MSSRHKAAAHERWSRVPDRAAQTSKARASSPAHVEWHLARLDPEKFADATDEQKLAAAESARKAYFARLTIKAVEARRAKGRKKITSAQIIADVLADLDVDLEDGQQ